MNQTVFLSNVQKILFNKVYDLFVSDTLDLSHLKAIADVDASEDDVAFIKLYAAILFLKNGSHKIAIELLNEISKINSYAEVLLKHIQEHNSFKPNVEVFKDAKPYAAWGKSKLAQTYFKTTVKQMAELTTRFKPSDGKVTIFEVGIGTGILTATYMNEMAQRLNINKITVVALDQSQSMLEAAKSNLEKICKVEFEWHPICKKVQDLSESQWSEIKALGPIWFTNAALAMHHVPFHIKSTLLGKLADISKYVIVTDIEANNDLPKEDTPEFVYSVTQLYRYIFDDVKSSGLSEEDEELGLNGFLFAESLIMLNNVRENRVDYHASFDQWKESAQKADLKVLDAHVNIQLDQIRPVMSTFVFQK